MTRSFDTDFPSRQTYVVKLRGDATPHALAGRLENPISGVRCEFTSAQELCWLIAEDLLSQDLPPAADAPEFDRLVPSTAASHAVR